MADYMKVVEKVISKSDIVILVVDARRIEKSRNRDLVDKIRKMNKKYLYVINKCDLISNTAQKKISLNNSVQISAKKHWGTMRLLRKINEMAKGEKAVIGIVGYPNVGKSTIINALKGRRSARTSSESGFTKGMQKIRVTDKIMMFDTPGVFSHSSTAIDHLVIGAKNIDKIKDPESAVIDLIEELNGKIERYFRVRKKEDAEETLEYIAKKKKILKKGGVPDTLRMAKEILILWQKGKIK